MANAIHKEFHAHRDIIAQRMDVLLVSGVQADLILFHVRKAVIARVVQVARHNVLPVVIVVQVVDLVDPVVDLALAVAAQRAIQHVQRDIIVQVAVVRH